MDTELVGLFDWYEIRDRRRMEAALETLEGVRKIGEEEWTWYEPASAGKRVMASLYVMGESLVLETEREDDADRCDSRLQAAAGGAVEYSIGEERRKEVGTDLGDWTRSRLAEARRRAS